MSQVSDITWLHWVTVAWLAVGTLVVASCYTLVELFKTISGFFIVIRAFNSPLESGEAGLRVGG